MNADNNNIYKQYKILLKESFDDFDDILPPKKQTSIKTVSEDGSVLWRDRHGKIHRDGDLPAAFYSNGMIAWCQHGETHRDNDKPALIGDGSKSWFQRGKLHRDNDEPAVIYDDGSKVWWRHGNRHRGGNKPAVINADGTKEWWRDGVFIKRED